MRAIARSIEKYTTITLNSIRFMDSVSFQRNKLATLADDFRDSVAVGSTDADKLKNGMEAFGVVINTIYDIYKHTMQGNTEADKKQLIWTWLACRKGVYPYEYMSSFDTLCEPSLPPIEAFFSQLSNKGIEPEDYHVAERVWDLFGCKNMADYTQLYVIMDVLLLDVIFEKFRGTCYQHYGLDACAFPTAPSLSWAAMLFRLMKEQPDIMLENMTNVDAAMMVQTGIRGGMCQVRGMMTLLLFLL